MAGLICLAKFDIFALDALGGTMGLCPLPGLGGQWADDAARIDEWDPDRILTLCTTPEMAELVAPDLPSRMEGLVAKWHHFPIEDFGIPDPVQFGGWVDLSADVRGVLNKGGRVLIHCRGGCGRSGMAALRLMVDGDEDPTQALGQLRQARPCAVETDAQMMWATDGATVRSGGPKPAPRSPRQT